MCGRDTLRIITQMSDGWVGDFVLLNGGGMRMEVDEHGYTEFSCSVAWLWFKNVAVKITLLMVPIIYATHRN